LFCLGTELFYLPARGLGLQEWVVDHTGKTGVEFLGADPYAGGDAVGAAADDVPHARLVVDNAQLVGAISLLATHVRVGFFQHLLNQLEDALAVDGRLCRHGGLLRTETP
jgi:hypothetical protein